MEIEEIVLKFDKHLKENGVRETGGFILLNPPVVTVSKNKKEEPEIKDAREFEYEGAMIRYEMKKAGVPLGSELKAVMEYKGKKYCIEAVFNPMAIIEYWVSPVK